MKKIIPFLLFLSVTVLCFSCKDDENPSPEPSFSIMIEEENTHPVISQQGGTVYIPFTVTNDWTATLMNDRADSWITVTPSSGTQGENELTITTVANETYDERNATIVLKCGSVSKNIVVTQKQKDALTVTSSKYEVDAKGGTINVEVKANIDFEVEIKADWIAQEQAEKTRALTTSNLNFIVSPNETGDKREGEIIIKSGELSETIKVYQGDGDFIVLTRRDFTLSEEGGNVDIEIKSTLDYSVKMLSDVDWITEIQTRAVSTHTHHYAVSPNESYDSREAKIVFYNTEDENIADTVSIYQMYKGAILVARDEYQFGIDGGTLELTVQTNLEFDIEISDSWIQQVSPTRALTEYNLSFAIAENTTQKDREGSITVKDRNSNKKQVVTVKQRYVDLEREALIAFYKATNGDNWKNNTNWCSDKPISEWYGIDTFNRNWGTSLSIALDDNNLSGTIPVEIGQISRLEYLTLSNNKLTGEIPNSICNLEHLDILDLGDNSLNGSIPKDIGNLKSLVTFRACRNNLEGIIPEHIGELTQLETFDIEENRISGNIPESVGNLTKLRVFRAWNNNLEGNIPEGFANLSSLVWLQISGNRLSGTVPAKLVQYNSWRYWNPSIDVLPQQEGYILTCNPDDFYKSTDYSKDKEVTVLQTHTKGNGIKVVIMGDLFTDRDMGHGGEYEKKARNAMKYYFSIEPLKSLRDLFDVIMIKAVSKNDLREGESVFSTNEFGMEDKNKCMEYAQEAIGGDNLDNVRVIMMQNIPAGLGITYLYTNEFSIACCPCLYDDRVLTVPDFEGYIHHEAIGHGLAFLHDEYIFYTGTIPTEEKNNMQQLFEEYGWYANIDFTDDSKKVKWAHFITDSRYTDEQIGIIEGAYWEKGIYRAQGGVMITTQGCFNAPSREAIYKRVMKLAYGDSWRYDYETFVKFDIPGHTEWVNKYGNKTRAIKQKTMTDYKHVPPVIYNYPAVVK